MRPSVTKDLQNRTIRVGVKMVTLRRAALGTAHDVTLSAHQKKNLSNTSLFLLQNYINICLSIPPHMNKSYAQSQEALFLRHCARVNEAYPKTLTAKHIPETYYMSRGP